MDQATKKAQIFFTLKNTLIGANFILVFALVALSNYGILPFRAGDFIFFFLLTLGLALYRPGWAFLFFVGTIPLEITNLSPELFGINVRPYQFIGACIVLAVVIRLLSGRLNFRLARLQFADHLVLIMSAAGFASAAFSNDPQTSLKLSLTFASFAVLYFLTRNYVRNIADLVKIIPFFLSASAIVVVYAIWQNLNFIQGRLNFETMPGRPNATFLEADWLGIFLVVLINVAMILMFYKKPVSQKLILRLRSFRLAMYFFLSLSFLALILTVSRSAWLGGAASIFLLLFASFTHLKFDPKNWAWKETFWKKAYILSALAIAILCVNYFDLTNFELLGRASSTGTGLQEITISCPNPVQLIRSDASLPPVQINDVSELDEYGCRHINLEDIKDEEAAGNIVSTVMRPDPNINIRAGLYEKSWGAIKENPVLGIGWGSIGSELGKDSRGFFFNSSNLFMEAWLGMGLIGLASLILLLGHILLRAVKNFFFADSREIRYWSLFVISSWFGLVVANLFNAGLFLGFFWLWLAVTQIDTNKKIC